MQEEALKARRKDLSSEGSDVESVDLQRDMNRKEEELKVRKAELENLKDTVAFSEAVKEDKWELTAPEGEGLSRSSANEDMHNHLPEELLEGIIKMTVEDPEEERRIRNANQVRSGLLEAGIFTKCGLVDETIANTVASFLE